LSFEPILVGSVWRWRGGGDGVARDRARTQREHEGGERGGDRQGLRPKAQFQKLDAWEAWAKIGRGMCPARPAGWRPKYDVKSLTCWQATRGSDGRVKGDLITPSGLMSVLSAPPSTNGPLCRRNYGLPRAS
jgi:hypothetical protein